MNTDERRLAKNGRKVAADGDAVVLEPAKPKTWPEGFFDSIHATDPALERPEQGQLPPIRNL